MRVLAVLISMAWMGGAGLAYAAQADNGASVPILLELFTSEGCSSCPPADAWLQRIDTSQPIPGAQAIVLSEHVDYWNHDGWKDPYSSSAFTERQSGYVHNLGLDAPYTPQVIVDGRSELKLNEPKQLSQVLLKVEESARVPISISALSFEGQGPAILRAHVAADGSSVKRNADIFAAVALDHAESQVLRGENSGRHLIHVAVVDELIRIGKLEKGKSFNQDLQINLKPGLDPQNVRLVVFVQQADYGYVLGSALQKSGVSSK
jgi:hypothetical protein